MVRRRYYYRRTLRPKQKWSVNFVDTNVSFNAQYTVPTNGNIVSTGGVVCSNATRINSNALSSISSAQILKTGRWKFKGILSNVSTNINYIIYLVYVPEGMYPTGGTGNDFFGNDGEDIFYRHPEWVIAWTRKDYVSIEQSNEISLTGRLKRNLNTGDSIQLRVLMYNMGTAAITVSQGSTVLRGTVSYCCRAN